MESVYWEGASLKRLSLFPKKIKKLFGYQLMRLQMGLSPSDWKPMSSVGRGVKEIRIHSNNEYRVIYVTKLHGAIHVLHAFVKKTQKTSKHDLEIAQKHYQELCNKKQ